MKLIWQIIKKDALRDRWALLTWALLFVGQIAIGVFARNSAGIDDDAVVYLQLASGGLVFLQVVMGYVLVARLVHADALVGSSMFWRTRPISAGRLLAAKLLGVLLLFALLPVLLLLPWWLYCQFGWHEVLWSAVDLVGLQLLMIAPALLVASLTDDLGRLLLWTLLLVIGLFSWIVLLQASFETKLFGAGPAHAAVIFSKFWVSSVIFVLGGIAIAAHQYLTRRFMRSVVLVAGCLGLIALTGQAWRWDWAKAIAELHQPGAVAAPPALVEGLTIKMEPGVGFFNHDTTLRPDGLANEASLDSRYRVRGLPAEMWLAVEDLEQTWTWSNGTRLARTGQMFGAGNSPQEALVRQNYSLPVPQEDPETKQWTEARQVARGYHPDWDRRRLPLEPGELQMDGYTRVPNSFLEKMRTDPPAFVAQARFVFYRPEIVTALPLQAGARAAGQSQTFELRWSKNDRALLVMTRSSVSNAGLWTSAATGADLKNWLFQDPPMVVNDHTGDLGWVNGNQAGSQFLVVGGVVVNWNRVHLGTRRIIREGKWVDRDPQWPQHTTLVFLTHKEVGRFSRELKAEKYAVEIYTWEKADSGGFKAVPAVKP